MNPLKEEEESEAEVVPWRKKENSAKVKSLASHKKKSKLTLSRPNSNLGRDQIDRILETYDFQALHDRILKNIFDS